MFERTRVVPAGTMTVKHYKADGTLAHVETVPIVAATTRPSGVLSRLLRRLTRT